MSCYREQMVVVPVFKRIFVLNHQLRLRMTWGEMSGQFDRVLWFKIPFSVRFFRRLFSTDTIPECWQLTSALRSRMNTFGQLVWWGLWSTAGLTKCQTRVYSVKPIWSTPPSWFWCVRSQMSMFGRVARFCRTLLQKVVVHSPRGLHAGILQRRQVDSNSGAKHELWPRVYPKVIGKCCWVWVHSWALSPRTSD